MLLTLGPKRVVCIDGTRGTNGYDFTLITTLVIDEIREGFSVAWCLSNRTDQLLLPYYFQAKHFFGSGSQKLLCTWHVDHAWQGNLNRIQNREHAATVYHNL